MSDTPRTDPYEGHWATKCVNRVTLFDHARKLERELNEALKPEWYQSCLKVASLIAPITKSAGIVDGVEEVIEKLNEARSESLAWQGNCERMAEQHGELSKELGEARLALRDSEQAHDATKDRLIPQCKQLEYQLHKATAMNAELQKSLDLLLNGSSDRDQSRKLQEARDCLQKAKEAK